MAGLKIGRMVLGMVQTNCYFVYREGDNRVLVVDPADKGEVIYKTLKEHGLEVAGILLTHAHFDHVMGLKRLQQLADAKSYCAEAEKVICENPAWNLSESFLHRDYTITPDIWLHDGEEVTVADMKFRMIETPGHTIGSCCYYFEEGNLLLCGDTLFHGSVGRTDFETGSMSQIVRSIKEKLYVLPDEVVCYPGHGDQTTIGEEKENNPFTV